ncbi:MAG: hypothetical protein U0W75_00760 [Buchnera aphidicola (Schlechtendalia chinensis)]
MTSKDAAKKAPNENSTPDVDKNDIIKHINEYIGFLLKIVNMVKIIDKHPQL